MDVNAAYLEISAFQHKTAKSFSSSSKSENQTDLLSYLHSASPQIETSLKPGQDHLVESSFRQMQVRTCKEPTNLARSVEFFFRIIMQSTKEQVHTPHALHVMQVIVLVPISCE